jgi:hypothetical protein
MYLTLDQVNHVLGSPHYSVPFTESLINYALYRGHLNSKVYTVRFNIIETVNEDFIFNHLYTQLLSRFPLESRFRALYDMTFCCVTLNKFLLVIIYGELIVTILTIMRTMKLYWNFLLTTYFNLLKTA